jgi:hypothetical protein
MAYTNIIEHNTCIARKTVLRCWQKIAERGGLNARWAKAIKQQGKDLNEQNG